MDPEKKDNKAAVGGAVVDGKAKAGSEPQKTVSSDLLIVDKHYELTRWYALAIAKFSRDRRRVLGDRLDRSYPHN